MPATIRRIGTRLDWRPRSSQTPPKTIEKTHNNPETLNGETEVLACQLPAQRDGTHPDQTQAPPKIGDERNADPDKEQTPGGCIQLVGDDQRVGRGHVLNVRHRHLPVREEATSWRH